MTTRKTLSLLFGALGFTSFLATPTFAQQHTTTWIKPVAGANIPRSSVTPVDVKVSYDASNSIAVVGATVKITNTTTALFTGPTTLTQFSRTVVGGITTVRYQNLSTPVPAAAVGDDPGTVVVTDFSASGPILANLGGTATQNVTIK